MRRATLGGRVLQGYAWVIVALRHVIPPLWIAAAVFAWIALPPLGGSSSALGDIVPEEAFAVQERAIERFGSTVGTDTAVVLRDPGGLERDVVEAHVRAARDAGGSGITAAVPLPNVEAPGVRWPERRTTIVTYLFLDPELNLRERDEVAQRYADRLPAGQGGEVGVTGAGPARLAQFRAIDDALPWVEAATVAVILLIVALYFRSPGAPLVTLVTAVVAYVVAVRGMAWAGERVGVTAPGEIEPVLVVLLLGLVTDYTIFFMSEARRRLARGESKLDAARGATTRIAPIVFAAGIVVAGASASLLAADLEFFRVFGPGLAVCALVVTLVCVTFVPAVIALLGPRIFGRRVREARARRGAADEAPMTEAPARAGSEIRDRWRLRTSGWRGTVHASREHARSEGGHVLPALVSRLLATRPVALVVALVCVGGLVAVASAARSAQPAVSFMSSLPEDSPVRRAATNAERGFGPGILGPTEVVVAQPGIGGRLDGVRALRRLVGQAPGVEAVLGPVADDPQAPLSGVFVSEGGDAARLLVLLAHEPSGGRAVATLERLRERMPALLRDAGLPEGRVAYVGETALAADTVDATLRDLARVSVVALLVIFGLLAIFLRAILAAALLVLASALGLAAAFGLTALLAPWILGGHEVVHYVPLVAGVLLVGLGSDYNVFIAGRIREEARRRRLREAIAVGSASASRAIAVAGVTLAATFALLAIVPLRPFRELALVMAVGVLLDVLLVRRFLVPALLAVAGDAAWWPGRLRRPPDSDALVADVVARRGGPASDARIVTVAVLETLAERIPGRQAGELADQLPDDLAARVRARAGRGEAFGSDTFVERVAERSSTPTDRAREDVRAVVASLGDALPATELAYVLAGLSDDYRLLLEPSQVQRAT